MDTIHYLEELKFWSDLKDRAVLEESENNAPPGLYTFASERLKEVQKEYEQKVRWSVLTAKGRKEESRAAKSRRQAQSSAQWKRRLTNDTNMP